MVSFTCTILTSRSLIFSASHQTGRVATYSLHTATRAPVGSSETHRIGTPDERVMKPSNWFWGYENTRAMLSSEPVTRLWSLPSAAVPLTGARNERSSSRR